MRTFQTFITDTRILEANKKAVQLNGFFALLAAHPVQTAGPEGPVRVA
jgi:hypothetical protein